MKKILSLTLALLMVLTIPCTASATEATSELIIESFSLDEVIKAPSVTIGDDELVTTVLSGDQEMIIESSLRRRSHRLPPWRYTTVQPSLLTSSALMAVHIMRFGRI